MTKYMSKNRFILLCGTIVFDILIILFTLLFASCSNLIKGIVVLIMVSAIVYELFDSTKKYREDNKKKQKGNQKTGRHKEAA